MRDTELTEVKAIDKKRYYIRASWEGRAETPDELAARFLGMMDAFKEINPVFSLWTCGAKRRKKFEMVRDRYAERDRGGNRIGRLGRAHPGLRLLVWRDHARHAEESFFLGIVQCRRDLEIDFPQSRKAIDIFFGRSSTGRRCRRISGLLFRLASDRGRLGARQSRRLFPAADSAERKRLPLSRGLDAIPLPVAGAKNHAAVHGPVRAFAERRALDVGDDGNLRCRQPRASQSRARHGRRDGAVERAALAFAPRVIRPLP